VKFDRILDPFTGPFEKLSGFAQIPPTQMPSLRPDERAFAWSRGTNDAFLALNRLLKAGELVYTATQASGSVGHGTFFVRPSAAAQRILTAVAAERGLKFSAVATIPEAVLVRAPRIALWDVYGGEISSGWMRYVFDQFEFPYEVVFANDIDTGDLSSKYDVLILPDGAVLSAPSDSAMTFQPRSQPAPEKIPAEWRSRLGRISVAKSLPKIRAFVENGGTLLALGDAAEIGYKLGLPIADAVVDENGKSLPRSKYYVPGSVLSVAVDTTNAIAWGMSSPVDIFFDNDPAFRLQPAAAGKNVKQVAWFSSASPLRSGWAWGQKVLEGASEIVTAPLGKGSVVLYGPQVHFRGQTHGAFRFLFNGIYYGQVNRP
jgi:hypothetical protein